MGVDVIEERELIRRARAGETGAFGNLVAATAPALLRFIGGLADFRAEEREEIAQEAFVRAFERFDQYQSGRNFGAWVGGFARFVACEHLARRKRQAEVRRDLIGAAAAAAATRMANEGDDERVGRRMAALRNCVQSLPDPMRNVLRRHYDEGLGLDRIAAAASRPLGTVKSILHRARLEVRKCIERKLVGSWEPGA